MSDTTHLADLTGFQRDLLNAIAATGGTPDAIDDSCPYGLAVKRQIEEWRGYEINHGRLYPNLDALVDAGYVSKHKHDRRTNGYRVTKKGVDAIVGYHEGATSTALSALGVA